MSKWQRVKLSDVSESVLGKMLDQNKNKGEYQPYLANIDVRWGEFDLDHLGKMKFEKHEEERYGLQYGDLLVCEGGEPGRCAIWKNQIPNMKFQKALHRVRANLSVLDNRFLFYWFLLAGKTGELEQYFTGATIKHMPRQKLKEVKIFLPPLEVQRKIADVLSAYDDLIENNRKQIKLLEEAAQRLYKEWFIDLRFPGYETTPIVNGIPDGWERKTVVQLLNKIKRTKQVQAADYLDAGLFPIIDQSREFVAGYTNDSETVIRSSQPLIVFGDHTRILKLISFPFAKGADGTQIIMSNNENMPQHLFYCSLREIDLSNYHYARHFKYLKSESILIPPVKTAQKIEKLLSNFFTKIQQCRNIIIKSEVVKNVLLHKVMHGNLI